MHRNILLTAAILGALAVVLGAFGAHALRDTLTPQQLNTYETAVRYQFYHVFALALSGMLLRLYPYKMIRFAARAFVAGIVLFSGSLYAMIFLSLQQPGSFSWLGAVTPVGGLLFILGWIFLGIGAWKAEKG